MPILLCLLLLPSDGSVVENGRVPTQPLELSLTESLRIGYNSDEEYALWTGPYVTYDIDEEGRLLVADDHEERIVVFDRNGAFLKQVGREGQGPGEFQGLRGINVLSDGRVMAFESFGGAATLTCFDAELNYIEETRPRVNFSPTFFAVSPNGRIAACSFTRGDPVRAKMTKGFALINLDFEIQTEVTSVDVQLFDQSRTFDRNFWIQFLADQLKQNARGLNGFVAFTQERSYTAAGNKYEVTVYDRDFQKRRVIRRDYKPLARTEAEIMATVDPIKQQLDAQLPPEVASIISPSVIREAIELADFPTTKNPVFGLIAMEDGFLAVVHEQNPFSREGRADIFDDQGRYRGSFRHGNGGLNNMRFKYGHAFAMETDDEGEQELVRYDLTWN